MASSALIDKFRATVKDNGDNQLWTDDELSDVLDSAIGEATLPVGYFNESGAQWSDGWAALAILIGHIQILATLSSDQALRSKWAINNKMQDPSSVSKNLNSLMSVLVARLNSLRDAMLRYATAGVSTAKAPAGGDLRISSSDTPRGRDRKYYSNIGAKNKPKF